jgi:FkbM family methyltransferase
VEVLTFINRAMRYAKRVSRGFCTAQSKHRFFISELAMLTGLDVPGASFETADGSRLRLHAEGVSLGLWQGTYEDRASIRVCTDFLRPGDIAIDVGANIGHFTVAIGNAVGCSGRVISIEPNPRAHRRLQENVRLNGLHNVTCERVAMCRDDGTIARFFVPRRTSGEGALSAKSTYTRFEEFDVLCRSGERLLSELGLQGQPLALMKIDVEGHEADVLEGFGATLTQFDSIMFEYDVGNFRAAGHSPEEVLDVLSTYGYRVYFCDPDAGEARHSRPDLTGADLVAVRDPAVFRARTGYDLAE